METLSALDIALIKIHLLEREAEKTELRLAALRCRLTEVLYEGPRITIVKQEDL